MITKTARAAVYLHDRNPSAKIVNKHSINLFNRSFGESFFSALFGNVAYFKDVENTNGRWIKMQNKFLSKKIRVVKQVDDNTSINELDDLILELEENNTIVEVSSLLDLWDFGSSSEELHIHGTEFIVTTWKSAVSSLWPLIKKK